MQWKWESHAKEQPELSPPITDNEQRWWSVERKKYLRRTLLRFGLPMFLLGAASSAIRGPERLPVFLPIYATAMFAFSWALAKSQATTQRKEEVRWKRIRESLLADSPDEKP